MNKKIPYILYAILAVSLGYQVSVYAQGEDNPPPPPAGAEAGTAGANANAGAAQGPGGRPMPGAERAIPQQAIAACSGKAAGDACSFTGRKNNNIDGICRTPPRAQGQMVCMPKPPQQAFDACKGKAEGDACTFTGRMNNARNGTCKKAPMGEGQMVCRPERPPVPAGTQEGNTPPAPK